MQITSSDSVSEVGYDFITAIYPPATGRVPRQKTYSFVFRIGGLKADGPQIGTDHTFVILLR